MPTLNKNNILRGLSGMLGDQVVFVNEPNGGRQYIRNKPKYNKKKRTLAQKELLRHFYNGAVNYWRNAVKPRPESVLAYKDAAPPGLNAYNMAIKDYLTPPVIHKISLKKGARGKTPVIQTEATDIFRVTRVHVAITKPDNTFLEFGDAVQIPGKNIWNYTCHVIKNPIPEIIVKVAVYDFPQHSAEMTQTFGTPEPSR